MFRMSDGRYWARRSQHERMRPTEGNIEKMKTKKPVSTYDARDPLDRLP